MGTNSVIYFRVTIVERPAKSVRMIISLFIIMAHKLYECVELSMFWKAAQETECRTNATFHGRTGNEFFFSFVLGDILVCIAISQIRS